MYTPHISVELIPRNEESLIQEAQLLSQIPEITHINIPDLARFSIRSHAATALLHKEFRDRFIYVPHIPAMHIAELAPSDIPLVVQGDHAQDVPRESTFGSLHLIKHYTHQGFAPMAAIDQYRSALKDEVAYIHQKIEAGSTGFFTQPFFSLTHALFWHECIPEHAQTFYGVSPVMTENSARYWVEKNSVIFPPDFSIEYRWQIQFGKKMIKWAKERNTSLYFMPIRTPIKEYMNELFG